MKRLSHVLTTRGLVLAAYLAFSASAAAGQDQTSLGSALDSLLNLPVSTASKFAQTSREAAASITVITSEQIRTLGFRTLGEALEIVPGFYITSNRSHDALGVRAFGPLSLDNNRVLILLDGHSLNENFLDGAPIGNALGMDLSIIERIEVVHGPGSALYGSNAMLAVVNLITRSGRDIDGLEVSGEIGSYGMQKGSVVFGTDLESGLGLALSGTWFDTDGSDLYFPTWDSPLTNSGVASGNNWDEGKGARAAATFRDWSLTGFFSDRAKGDPTAPFGSDFGSPDAQSSNRRFFGELSFDRDLATGKNLRARAYYDEADFGSTFPYEATQDVVGGTSGQWFGAEGHFRWDLAPAYRVTVGTEVRRNSEARIWGGSPFLGVISGNYRSTISSGFGQADLQLHERLRLTVGGRLDNYSSVGTAFSPRGGLVFNASPSTTLKALYGEAFRAPTQTELNVEAEPLLRRNPDIQPEEIRTVEVVWEQRVSTTLYATLAAYDYSMARLISASADGTGTIFFSNTGSGSVNGIEASLDARPGPHVALHGGYAYQRPREDNAQFVNSPAHTFRAWLSSTRFPAAQVGVRASYETGRRDGGPTGDVFLTDATLTSELGRYAISAVVRNLFDASYGHPAAEFHRQREHPQEGRTLRLRLDFRF